MPTYVYGCDACGHRFEQFQKFADEPIRVCPQCQSTVRRILQPAGIVFKGSGWHTTDYKRTGKSTSESNTGESNNGGEAQTTKSDSGDTAPKAPEAKPDAGASSATNSAKPAKAAS